MITVQTWKNGVTNGLTTTWMLLKIIIPVYVALTILNHTPVVGWVAGFFESFMGLTGLPGEAAIAFVTGALINVYAAMGMILAMNLDWYQMTILAVMLNISHELIVEAAVLKKTGIRVWPILVIRLGGAFLAGMLMNLAGRVWVWGA